MSEYNETWNLETSEAKLEIKPEVCTRPAGPESEGITQPEIGIENALSELKLSLIKKSEIVQISEGLDKLGLTKKWLWDCPWKCDSEWDLWFDWWFY